ncbi:MAG: hypothetical protein ACE5GX_10715 [Thermoanaerobaculia bacterium]
MKLGEDDGSGGYVREMTVAHVREPEGEGYVEVMFLESARIYRLERESPAFEEALRLLTQAVEGGVLRISLASIDSDTIEHVAPATGEAPAD